MARGGHKEDIESVRRRHALFVKEYLANGFNATQAYKTVYKPKSTEDVIAANASRLLRDEKVRKILSAYDTKELVSDDEIVATLYGLMKEAGRDGDKIRSAEILAKIKSMLSDSNVTVNQFNADKSLSDKLLARRKAYLDN